MLTGGDKVIGIAGGMGPKAGSALFDSIIRCTKARKDQEHLSVILMSFPRNVVDRTAFLEGATETNPASAIFHVIRKLEHAGADVVGIACNTSHCPPIYDRILEELHQSNSRVRLLNMPLETCRQLKEGFPQVRRVGVLATTGTYRSGLYAKMLHGLGLEVIVPDADFQHNVVHRMIYDPEFGIKSRPDAVSGEVGLLMERTLGYFRDKRSDAIILGCTELSIVVPEGITAGMRVIDSTESLARALVREAATGNSGRHEPVPDKPAVEILK